MCMVFQDVDKALRWCMQVQIDLLAVDWPVELFTHPAAAEEWGDVDDRVIFKVCDQNMKWKGHQFMKCMPLTVARTHIQYDQGPRVRMGVHVGEPRKIVDEVTRRADFVGPAVNTAARITTLAQGGQMLLSQAVWEKIKDTELAKERNRCAVVGKCELPDSPQGTYSMACR